MKRNLIAILLIAVAVFVAIKGIDIQSVEDYYLSHIDDITEDSETVFISIRCDTVLNNMDVLDESLRTGDYIPADGVILPRTEYVLREGDTVFSILSRAARYNKIQFEYLESPLQGQGGTYVKGIGYLYEFSCGPLSGWLFKVNGVFSSGDSAGCILNDGDIVEWVYSCDLGRDVGNPYGEVETTK